MRIPYYPAHYFAGRPAASPVTTTVLPAAIVTGVVALYAVLLAALLLGAWS